MCAQRRMFSMQIVDSDAFLEMPPSSQNLYFHLNMRADDDGFISNPKKIMKTINSNDDDLKILFSKRFVLGFESGIIVIKHWRMHNCLRKDRYNETVYIDEKNLLTIKDNGSYTERQPVGNQLATQDSIGKDSIGKDSIGKYSIVYMNQYFSITEDKYKEYKTIYNDIDIDKEFIKMKIWLDDNPTRRKTSKGYPRFISNWLQNAKVNQTPTNSAKNNVTENKPTQWKEWGEL